METEKSQTFKNAMKNHVRHNQKQDRMLCSKKVFEQAIEIMGDTIEDMDEEKRLKIIK